MQLSDFSAKSNDVSIYATKENFNAKLTNFIEEKDQIFGEKIKEYINQQILENDFVVLNVERICEDLDDFRNICVKLCELLGVLMVQNESGDTVIEVYNRDVGTIEQGARYHQTRQGGDIHTDSVNRAEPMKYLALGCAAPGLVGGETILLRAREVVHALERVPDVLNILRSEFYFEGRGMSEDVKLFKLPVLSEQGGKYRFRYLRSYITSAHERAGEPLTADQQYAFDVLDAVLETSSLQHRLTLGVGDILLAEDTSVFHGRTSFVDGAVDGSWAPRRHMLRCWII